MQVHLEQMDCQELQEPVVHRAYQELLEVLDNLVLLVRQVLRDFRETPERQVPMGNLEAQDNQVSLEPLDLLGQLALEAIWVHLDHRDQEDLQEHLGQEEMLDHKGHQVQMVHQVHLEMLVLLVLRVLQEELDLLVLLV